MGDSRQLRYKLSTSLSRLLLGRVHLGVFYMHGDLIFLKRKKETLQTLGFPTLNFKTYTARSQWQLGGNSLSKKVTGRSNLWAFILFLSY